MKVDKNNPVIAWWSGGVTSAVTCKICIDWFGVENVRLIFIDTKNEDKDTYRFMKECEVWYDSKIETITNPDFENIQEVWYKNLSLNVATGAKCSQILKRVVRERFEKSNNYSFQAFGFDIDEIKRAKGMASNNPKSMPIFPLIANLLTKKDCIRIVQDANSLFLKIQLPITYRLGYLNNNCWQTGCVQGGIGYWQKIQLEFPDKFNTMANIEHELTDMKGEPVTMLKDQSEGGGLVFLKPHPDYPTIKDISMMKGRPVKPLMDCNGFCGSNDLTERNETELEINYAF
jgi:PP-loop superfamily ATP-utilizing enzyme